MDHLKSSSKPATNDPSTVISFEEIIGAPLYTLVENWEKFESSALFPAELSGRLESLLDVVAWLCPTSKLEQLRGAVK
jgi:hypothetical protein